MRRSIRLFLRHHGWSVGALLAAMTVVAAVLPPIGESTDRLDARTLDPATAAESSAGATTTAPTAPTTTSAADPTPSETPSDSAPSDTQPEATPANTTVPDTTAPDATAPDATAPDTTSPDTRPPDATQPSTVAPSTTAPEEASLGPVDPAGGENAVVVSIQTVPAVRNLIILIGGRPRATDSEGMIDLAPDEIDAEVEVVGLAAEPPIERVALLQWSDGNRQLERSLAGVPGPVLQLGLEVRNRVFVELDESAPALTSVGFVASSGEELTLTIDEPAWVPRARAILIDDELITDELDYELVTDGDTLEPATYRPRPEASWVIVGR